MAIRSQLSTAVICNSIIEQSDLNWARWRWESDCINKSTPTKKKKQHSPTKINLSMLINSKSPHSRKYFRFFFSFVFHCAESSLGHWIQFHPSSRIVCTFGTFSTAIKKLLFTNSTTQWRSKKVLLDFKLKSTFGQPATICYESLRNIAPFVSQLSFFDNFRLVNFRNLIQTFSSCCSFQCLQTIWQESSRKACKTQDVAAG